MKNQSFLQKTAIAFILFTLFLNYVGIGLVFSLFPQLCYDTSLGFLPLTATAGERSIILGLLLALMPLTQFFFAPLLGIYSDSIGRKPLLIKSLAIGFLGYCLGAYSIYNSSLWMLLTSRVLVGVASSNSSVIAASIADLSPKEKRASSFALYGMSVGFGLAIGPLLGAMLSQKSVSWTSYSLPFIAAGIMTLFNLVSVFFSFPKYTQKIEAKKEYISPIKLIVQSFFAKEMRIYFLMAATFYFGWTFFWEFVPVTLIHTMNYKTEDIGLIYSVGAIAYTISNILVTRKLMSKMAIATLLPISLFAISLFVAALGLVHTKTTLFSFIVLQQFFISCIYPLLTTYVSQNSPDTEQGKSLGMLVAVKAAACSLGPLCSGCLFRLSEWTPIAIGFLCLFISFSLSIYFFSPFRKPYGVESEGD